MQPSGHTTFCTTQKLLPNRGLEWTAKGPGEVLFGGNILEALQVIPLESVYAMSKRLLYDSGPQKE